MLRSLICTFVGHVDHGKTTLQDVIRGTSVAKTEPGLITQHISFTNVSFSTIQKICGNLLKGKNITIPGFLFLDTPGHASFTNLRKRGGTLADIAVLVIDIHEGIKPQTSEAIDILRNYKTPFVIALTKIDLISGYRKNKPLLIENINAQSESTQENLDRKLYELVGKLAELNLNADRYDRVDDFTKQIAIIPVSAKMQDGIPELLMMLSGLGQKYLENELKVNLKNPGKATIMEIKEDKGIGTCLDIILYEGHININDKILIGTLEKPLLTKVKALFLPDKNKLKSVERVEAACGVKINALECNGIIAGMPLRVANKDQERIAEEMQEEIDEVLIETERDGVIIKADTLGSLEALVHLLKDKNIKIKKASIGDINKKDITEASSEKDPKYRVILAFNVKQLETTKEIKIIKHNVIYQILDDYEAWVEKEQKDDQAKSLQKITRPFKIQLISGYIFRQSNPLVVGVEVLAGTLKNKTHVMNKAGEQISEVTEIQEDGKAISEAKKGKEVAVALSKVTFGRQIHEQEVLYSVLTENDIRSLREHKDQLTKDEIDILKEIVIIKRKENPTWAM